MFDFKDIKTKIKGAEDWLKKEYMSLRTGIATPSVLDSIQVESYGMRLPINQVATIGVEDARVLRITPYDKSQSKEIEKAISAGNLGLSVGSDDKGVRVFFPELTGDRRTLLIKTAKEKLEEAKKNVRYMRDEEIKIIDKKEKEGGIGKDEIFRFKNELQKIIDESNRNFESLLEKKEKEINN